MADQGGAYGCGVAAGGCGCCGEDCRTNLNFVATTQHLVELYQSSKSNVSEHITTDTDGKNYSVIGLFIPHLTIYTLLKSVEITYNTEVNDYE